MIKLLASFLIITILSGCLNLKPENESGEFYTWVDERGQLHTLKKESKKEPKKEPKKEVTPKDIETEIINTSKTKVLDSKSLPANDFKSSDFVSSDEIDKKINGANLYSWNQDGRQEIVESNVIDKPDQSLVKIKSRPITPLISFIKYREGKQVPLSTLLSRELSLEQLYTTNKILNTDYVLIEVDIIINELEFKSFIKSNKTPLPAITFLDVNYNAEGDNEIFTEYSEETWSNHGYFNGVLSLPTNTAYVLITPNPLNGVIETPESNITISNFGNIQISNSIN